MCAGNVEPSKLFISMSLSRLCEFDKEEQVRDIKSCLRFMLRKLFLRALQRQVYKRGFFQDGKR
jgi:hypothetical protein